MNDQINSNSENGITFRIRKENMLFLWCSILRKNTATTNPLFF
ncbi:hypothetical protein ATC1_131701 [Flexilinea flocculi]|uniref:Uncharacterized protein n=1 Tax=Flexilinea flocculi TaxID=1678840 RepID=A0A0S7BYE2_9CHLR|nr:hypothetical protein ATC1_131701 [Flexilinea flocculi]